MGKKTYGPAEPGRALLMFDRSAPKARERYRAFLAEGGKISPEKIMNDLLTEVVIGSGEFVKKICERLKREDISIPGKLMEKIEDVPDRIINLVCEEFGVNRTELITKKGKQNYSKKAAIYMIWKIASVNYSRIGELFGNIHRSNVIRTIRSAEIELGKNPEFASILQKISSKL